MASQRVKREFCVLVVLSKVIAPALLWKYPSFVDLVMERGLWRVEFPRVLWVSSPCGGDDGDGDGGGLLLLMSRVPVCLIFFMSSFAFQTQNWDIDKERKYLRLDG